MRHDNGGLGWARSRAVQAAPRYCAELTPHVFCLQAGPSPRLQSCIKARNCCILSSAGFGLSERRGPRRKPRQHRALRRHSQTGTWHSSDSALPAALKLRNLKPVINLVAFLVVWKLY